MASGKRPAAKKPAARKGTEPSKQQEEQKAGESEQTEEPSEQQEEQKAGESEQTEKPSEPVEEYKPSHPTLENAGLDQHAAEKTRESERQAQREEHNARVGDASR